MTVAVVVLVVVDVVRDRLVWRAQMSARREWKRTKQPVPGWSPAWQVAHPHPHPSLLSRLGISEDEWWSLAARRGRRGVVAAVVTAVVHGPVRPAPARVAVQAAPVPGRAARAMPVRVLPAGADVEDETVTQDQDQGIKEPMIQTLGTPRNQVSKVPRILGTRRCRWIPWGVRDDAGFGALAGVGAGGYGGGSAV